MKKKTKNTSRIEILSIQVTVTIHTLIKIELVIKRVIKFNDKILL